MSYYLSTVDRQVCLIKLNTQYGNLFNINAENEQDNPIQKYRKRDR